jgi:hippurate hydrolase
MKMPVKNRIAGFHTDMSQGRHHLHAHPERSDQEHETARFVAEKLRSFGIEVTEGVGGTGIVGVLHGNHESGRFIGLRADMDALAIEKRNDREHRSTNRGVMHAYGHVGYHDASRRRSLSG